MEMTSIYTEVGRDVTITAQTAFHASMPISDLFWSINSSCFKESPTGYGSTPLQHSRGTGPCHGLSCRLIYGAS
ncbi:hypothetical protein N7510_002939 [Penicillium lagena]|uniref:uncharacterized protein n=1 Tax=Penicillium lagena TaxID=94218 RepID=UPI00254269BD|nr:uncharacterized protein N7510_002939 [Penicillium lagena]KAJ5618955.1 hypothetical protein N7510_002939 [Penicillium lagena]